jgi:hypothetical protein
LRKASRHDNHPQCGAEEAKYRTRHPCATSQQHCPGYASDCGPVPFVPRQPMGLWLLVRN